jgi:hypothetical protein
MVEFPEEILLITFLRAQVAALGEEVANLFDRRFDGG